MRTNFCSAIMLSTNARFLYAANRLHNSNRSVRSRHPGTLGMGWRSMAAGRLSESVQSGSQRHILYACNLRSDQITSFRIDKETGLLTFTGRYTAVGTPLCITFVA